MTLTHTREGERAILQTESGAEREAEGGNGVPFAPLCRVSCLCVREEEDEGQNFLLRPLHRLSQCCVFEF